MTVNFENKTEDLGKRVRAILGVPEDFLTDEIVLSPVFIDKASKYVNKQIKDYEGLDEQLINIAFVYYVCYLLCFGMYARLPKQMENVSTKTVLQSIDWDSKALEMLGECNDALEEAIEEADGDIQYGNTYAKLSEASEYPNTNI